MSYQSVIGNGDCGWQAHPGQNDAAGGMGERRSSLEGIPLPVGVELERNGFRKSLTTSGLEYWLQQARQVIYRRQLHHRGNVLDP
jgi:hypothetical protein